MVGYKEYPLTEKEITKQIRDLLTACRIHHTKIWQGMMSEKGVSDIIACHEGKYVAIEIKRPGRKPSKDQADFLERVKESGGVAFVATCVEDVVTGLNLSGVRL